MKGQSLKKQTAVMSLCNLAIRGLGFLLRMVTARMLGAEALGVVELASQAHMLALTPAAAGLPGAVSRMTARGENPEGILRCARRMAVKMGCGMGCLLFFLAPALAQMMGDVRILPSLLFYAPCVLIIGVSGVYRGYSLGRGNAWAGALSELAEQGMRLFVMGAMAALMPKLTVSFRAAVPAAATVLGEGAGLCLMMLWLRPKGREEAADVSRQLFHTALPLTLNRLSHTLLRTCCSVLIPLRLCAAGLPQQEAISRVGMLNGMVMPMIFLPGMFTGALGMVSTPAVAACRDGKAKRRLMLRLLFIAGGVGAGCTCLLYLAAPFAGRQLFGLAEVGDMLRKLCPMALMLAVQQVLGGILLGLGLQRKGFYAALTGSLITLLFTYVWTARPEMNILGAGYAHLLGHGVTVMMVLWAFFRHQKTADGKASAV